MPPVWFMMGPKDKPILLNLSVCVGIMRDEQGNAMAISITGVPVPIGEPFDLVVADLTSDDEPEEPAPAGR